MWIAFSIAAGIFAAIITFVVLSRINGNIEETDEVEPIGDVVDVKNILNKYED